MDKLLQSVFDSVYMEEELKEKTIGFLRKEIENREPKKKRKTKFIAAMASFVFFCIAGRIGYGVYYIEAAYIDLDVNPAVELSVNPFNRVIGVHPLNEDGLLLSKALSLKHLNYKDAVHRILKGMQDKEVFGEDSYLSVTIQTENSKKEIEYLTQLESGIGNHFHEHETIFVDIYPVSADVRSMSLEWGVSPAKYLAIIELQTVDSAITVEECVHHSVGELKKMTQSHEHGNMNNYGQTEQSQGHRHGQNHK